jgi:hypothetical protein
MNKVLELPVTYLYTTYELVKKKVLDTRILQTG